MKVESFERLVLEQADFQRNNGKEAKADRDMYLKIIQIIAIIGCVQSTSIFKGPSADTMYNQRNDRATTGHITQDSDFKRLRDVSSNMHKSNDDKDLYVNDLMSSQPEDYSSKRYSSMRYVHLPKDINADVLTYHNSLAAKHDESKTQLNNERADESYLHKEFIEQQLDMSENEREAQIPGRYGDERYVQARNPKEIPGRYGDTITNSVTKRIPGRYGDNRNLGIKKNLNLKFKDTFSIPGRYGDEKKAANTKKSSGHYFNKIDKMSREGIPGRYGDMRYFAAIPGRYGDRKSYRSARTKKLQQSKRGRSEGYVSKNDGMTYDKNILYNSKNI